ncbi:MAG TPA: ABC transporter ATP-binding protein [Stellaceae bacterium]|nr:ABC transporter ATP-binding protein [Stellaceae bacterium]
MLDPKPLESLADRRPEKRAVSGAALRLAALAKDYGGVTALAPTDLEVRPGEFFSLIGPSGSGKSTLLGMVAGFVPPSAGRILIDGADVVALPPYRRNIGMVFQNYALFPHMSVAENIAFPLRMRKMPRSRIEARVKEMLETVRLAGFAERSPAQLSGGQQQRVALARAAAYDPALLLMDEPLGALDKNLREEMQYEIKRFHSKIGATILYVTHDQDEAATMSDRIAILNGGRIVQVGRPRELYEAPNSPFVASFLGEANLFEVAAVSNAPPMRLRVVTREGLTLAAHQHARIEAGVMICVRPEAIQIGSSGGAAANSVEGRVIDVVYTAGMLRYRIEVMGGRAVIVRRPLQRQVPIFEVGSPVYLSWDLADTILVPNTP